MKTARSVDKEMECMGPARATERHPKKAPASPGTSDNPVHVGIRPDEAIGLYERWREGYIKHLAVLGGPYGAIDGKIVFHGFLTKGISAPKFPFSWLRGIKRFSIFPNTTVLTARVFSSDGEAILNDWALVGSDLFEAISEYRIEHLHVHAGAEHTEPADKPR